MVNESGQQASGRQLLPYALFALALCGLYASSRFSYLLFHSLIEVLGAVILLTIFVLAWNSRKILDNHYLLFIGLSFLASGALELAHLFAYKGLGVFPGRGANLPTQLWIAFRAMFALSLLIAPVFISRRLDPTVALTAFTGLTVMLLVAVFTGVFPDCFIEGQGLTPFKVNSEYLIILALLVALGLLIRNRNHFDPRILRLLALAIFSGAAADLAFTQYVNVYDQANLIGHFLHLLSAVFIYRALVVTAIKEPMAILCRTLEQSEALYRGIGESIDYGVWVCTPDGRNTYASDSFLRMVGLSQEQCSGSGWGAVLHPDEAEHTLAAWRDCVRSGGTWDIEHRFRGIDGQWHPVLARGVPVRNSRGEITCWAGINLDISRIKEAEEQLKVSLAEKEVMLREIHHRVKNNLQVISSLISLQAEAVDDERMHRVFGDIRDRVRAMALVHEKLYQTGNLAQLNFADYAASLLQHLWRCHGALAERARLHLAIAPLTMPIETAVPCGLILNELAGNALKHAFGDGRSGSVTVTLDQDPDTKAYCLQVADNGLGLPPGLDWRQARSLGLRLVQILAGQLGGTVSVQGGDGVAFQVRFSLPEEQS